MLFVSLAAAQPQEKGGEPKGPPSLPGGVEYDVRGLRGGAWSPAEASARRAARLELFETRQRAAQDYLAAAPEALREARVSWDRFGLPKLLFHPELPLTEASQADPESIARQFLRQHQPLFLLGEREIGNLQISLRRPIPGGTLLLFQQTIRGVPLYRGQVQVVLSESGEVLQAGASGLIPALNVLTEPSLSAADAVTTALASLGVEPQEPIERTLSPVPRKWAFRNPLGPGLTPVTAGLVLFPLSPTEARLAWRLSLEIGNDRWYDLFLDAHEGVVLRRRNLATHMAEGRVWTESPDAGPRELVPFPDSWQTTMQTMGNNADAYLDRNGDNQPDSEPLQNIEAGRAFSPTNSFDFPAGQGTTGQDPRNFPAASVTNLYYFVNAAHDYFLDLGFTEAAGNFQLMNSGMAGAAGDAVRAEAQDRIRSNATFFTPEDGLPPRMQMGIFGGPTPGPTDDLDSSLDGIIVLHEYTHGVTIRMVGGPGEVDCLNGMQSGALGEGWSDYFGSSFFDTPVQGAYVTQNPIRGIRRFSLENYPLNYMHFGNDAFEVHNDGEIWAATLWDLRTLLGREIVDELVIAALPLTPCGPTYPQARDALLQADRMLHDSRHAQRMWQVFASRGLGFSAKGFDGDALNDRAVFTAAFDLPPSRDPANHMPDVFSVPQDQFYLNGDAFSYQINVSDEDGDAIGFELLEGPPGMSITPGGRVGWTVDAFTDQRALVRITDGRGGELFHGFSILVVTLMEMGRPIRIEGKRGSLGFAAVFIGENSRVVQFRMQRGEGDPDLLVFGPQYSGRSRRAGPAESLTVQRPAGPAFWLALVQGFRDYSGVNLSVDIPPTTSLQPDVGLNGLRREAITETYLRFDVPVGVESFTLSTGGGTGDVDLFLSREEYPTCQPSAAVAAPCLFEYLSVNADNFESITVNGAAGAAAPLRTRDSVTVPADAGTWFVELFAASAVRDLSVSLTFDTAGATAPAIGAGGVVNGASFAPLLAPGAIGSLFGVNLAPFTENAQRTPLPTTLATAQVRINGIPAPLFFASPEQINFQVPFETPPSGSAMVIVQRDGKPSNIRPVRMAPSAPGVFTFLSASGSADPVVIHADGQLVSAQNPAQAGEILVIFATGLGPVSNPPPAGEVAAGPPFSESLEQPRITVGGEAAQVLFAGLTPGFVGLAQFNIQLPDPLPGSGVLDLVIQTGDGSSVPVGLAVR